MRAVGFLVLDLLDRTQAIKAWHDHVEQDHIRATGARL